jgi:GH15 family glucan-1,4-alpha-glucosidase
MYGVYGERCLPERVLELEGWRCSTPVRAGNRAIRQLQLDMYGNLLDAAYMWHIHKGDIDTTEWHFMCSVVDQAVECWQEADYGIWELRSKPRHYVHSKVMVWVALDRGIRLADDHGLSCDHVAQWRATRDAVRRDIETFGVDPFRGHFVQHYDTSDVDASLLKLPLVGFIDANDERMRLTTDVIMQTLSVEQRGLLHRYRGAVDDEGVFLLCTCWLVEVLTLQNRLREAQNLFDAVLCAGNDLGLYAEEYVVERNELLGNFPQAYTHLGLISAAQRLRSALG